MTRLLSQVLEDAGITREELRELVLVRQAERDAELQRRQDAELLRLGREFAEERAERIQVQARSTVARLERERKPPPAPARPPLIDTAGCAAFHCTNAATVTVLDDFGGRPLLVRYCTPHGDERRADLAAERGQEARAS